MEIDPMEGEEQQMFASIIIPTKDEPTIQELVDSINAVIKQDHEILIIDKSLTAPVVQGAKVMIQRSNGLGNAFLEGLSCSRGDIIALMDGDGSHRPEDLQRMLRLIENCDIVLGSKLIDGGECNDAWARRLVTIAFARLTRLILGVDLKDPMTGFMVAKRDVFDDLELKPKGFKIVIEIVYKSRVEALEVPISFCERKAGSSKVGFNMNGLQEMIRIFELLIQLKLGRIRGEW
ncbi:MAG: glycosyltransferase [Methanothrix sp.]|jgi:dolichol-phosphate mannosyltransferase|uniref:glycosyltransferase n=1 Tax=Methanothrix sp. TaxID=90426 RepID=UPI0025E1544D|nr:glycosyltransferase [Methanothrix sp.]MBK7385426.1 glycosyltransferase [Methanothrix sp.]HPW72994.1 glycosyltransferase [Methanothrix sp.]